jgi:pyruvate kinase
MLRMLIRTKIVATVGPACGDAETLLRLAEAGCDVFRINFSHGDDAQREQFLANIRQAEAELGEPLAVMGDLCGPKIRVGPITGGSMLLAEGQTIAIHRELDEGGPEGLATTLRELPGAVEVGQAILLDDGKLSLKVVEAGSDDVFRCEVVRGGVLASGKGVNLPETVLGLSALTEKDRRDAAWIAQREFDYVALSFVCSPDDVEQLRALLTAGGSDARIVAKVEKPQALERIEEIVDAADAVMVARGDLGVEMDLPTVPIAQKRIARLCQARGKTCIIATQMLETMTQHVIPTRAEVSDVANAVLDLADAVMLSGETAVGKFPVRAVTMMNDIAAHTEAFAKEAEAPAVRVAGASSTTAALAAAVREIIAVEDVAAVAVFTRTGATARLLAKTRLGVPILALSPDAAAVRRMCLYYGVAPMQATEPEHTRDVLTMAGARAVEAGLAEAGQKLVVLSGRPLDQSGNTNTLVVHTIP